VLALDAAGVRGLRFNLYRGGSDTLEQLEGLGRRVAALAGWHVELYVDARHLPDLAPRLTGLEQLCVADHLGLSRAGLPPLLGLVERGAHVKASGFGRGDLDVPAVLRAIGDANPHALMFGTDLPSIRSRRPFRDTDIDLLREVLDEERSRRALSGNALAFYLREPRPVHESSDAKPNWE